MGRSGRAPLLVILLAAVAALSPSLAIADTGDIIAPSDPGHPEVSSGWQAGTCSEEPPESAQLCSVDTPSQFFERAAAHPHWGFTQFIIKHRTIGPLESPEGELKTVRVELPVGLSVNPSATAVCTQAQFSAGTCPPESEVGYSEVWASGAVTGIVLSPVPGVTKVPVYNVEPNPGEAARFGLKLAGNNVFLEGNVAWWGDYHEGFTIHVPAVLPEALGGLLGLLGGETGLILKNRLVFDGRSGDGTFITTPSTCLGPAYAPSWTPGELPNGPSGSAYSTLLRADSIGQPDPSFPDGSSFFESPIPPGTSPKECGTIPYEPSLEVEPGTAAVNSPAGAEVAIEVPHITGAGEQDSSDTRDATVTLPPGMGINPSAANGLQTCTDAEFGKGTQAPVACPPQSKIGTVKIESPPLPEGSLEGDVFVGRQLSRDPTSGDEYRIFVDAESARYGISVRLVGNVRADPRTGQLTTTFAETPQVPFSSFQLRFDGGARAALSSPPTCGPSQVTATMAPWSGNPPATPAKRFSLTTSPGGGACPASMAARPFAPAFAAGPKSATAGAYSPLSLRIGRGDGQQELKGADITLAPGMTGRLAGIPYCSEPALAAAAANAGSAEAASPSCPAASLVGSARIAAGTGPAPLSIEGKVFLSGPYHGAPLSLAVVTPATAGPFDLGTVVVRVALFVNPETAQITAVSDPIPDVFGGTQLSIRSVDLAIDRDHFTLNPTSCAASAIAGTLAGGGADPTNPATFSSAAVSAPFQTSDCAALDFRPKLTTTLTGGAGTTKRSQHPGLRATLVAREGDANIHSATLTLPHSEFLDQAHIRTICTRVQLAAAACPPGSVYGHASAQTPLLDHELSGPVYLVASEHELPDLLVDLQGQVEIRLRGVISSTKARIRTSFENVPDVPVSSFTLTMDGGKRGLLENSRDLCAKPGRSVLALSAQNGKRLKTKKVPLRVPACRARSSRKHGRD